MTTADAVRVKICGLTRLDDALAAARAGADALGLNFWPGSRRYVEPEAAAEIVAALPPLVTAVGVFVNQSRAEIERIASLTRVRVLQLHGDESPGDCAGFDLPVVKALRVGEGFDAAAASRYTVAAYLLDAPSAGYGGSGARFDWSMLAGMDFPAPLILAGGLGPDNVAEAVRLVRPYAVDVASGVESSPGVKDEDAMRRFVTAAKRALDTDAGRC